MKFSVFFVDAWHSMWCPGDENQRTSSCSWECWGDWCDNRASLHRWFGGEPGEALLLCLGCSQGEDFAEEGQYKTGDKFQMSKNGLRKYRIRVYARVYVRVYVRVHMSEYMSATLQVGAVPTFGARLNMAKVRSCPNFTICWRVRCHGWLCQTYWNRFSKNNEDWRTVY